jgi:subtilisin family serine protease
VFTAGFSALAIIVGTAQWAAASPAAPGRARAGAPAAASHVVTLITGDRVTVSGDGRVAIAPAVGRTGIRFVTQRSKDHLLVTPIDAFPLLREGKLDGRLFDVTELIRSGYADKRTDLPLILGSAGGKASLAATALPGVTVVRDLPAVAGQAVRVATAETGKLWGSLTGGTVSARTLRPGVTKVWLDGMRQPSLDVSVPQIGAPTAWAAGFDGTGERVAVLDTGIDVTHPDLVDRIDAVANFTEGTEDDRDTVGHGTHVASIIAGSGAASGGRYRGVAPGARLLDGKVCVSYGCEESWILAGMQWAAEQGASVVNLSLGGPDTPEIDPLEQAVNTLTDQYGVLFVIAAGNDPGAGTVSSPATADAALAVGAVDDTDALAWFSSQGPRAGDDGLKPDLTAPGVDITAALSKDAEDAVAGESYITHSGTSMATPHAAGSAALLAQRHPDWTPAQLKAGLMGSAAPNPDLTPYEQGAGRLDVGRAVTQAVVADPPSLSFGRQLYPHNDDPVLTKKVTYRNTGDTDVTLALALSATGPGGGPAPAGMFSVNASSVTVPAGGEATVTVTTDTRTGATDGLAGGRLVATGGAAVVQTPFAVDREAESYDLTLVHTGRTGEPPAFYGTTLVDLDRGELFDVFGSDATTTTHLKKGRYAVLSVIADDDGTTTATTFLAEPQLVLSANQALTLDARLGRPIKVTVPLASATPVLANVDTLVETPNMSLDFGLLGFGFDGMFSAQIGPDTSVPGFTSLVYATFAQAIDDDITDSPYVFYMAWFTAGRMVTGLDRRLDWGQLATVRAEYAVSAEGVHGFRGAWPVSASGVSMGMSLVMPFRLPFSRTEYYNADGVRWVREFDETAGEPWDGVSMMMAAPTAFRPDSTIKERWNNAVFGPAMPEPPIDFLWATRQGDTVVFAPPMFGDGVGREGYSVTTTEHTTVTRDGEVILDEPYAGVGFDAPPGAANYKVAIEADRGAPFTLSTHVAATWTFRSSHVDGEAAARLPLSVVRFAPPLDVYNSAPAGKKVTIPVTVDSQPGAKAPHNRSLTVDVSFDDGKTWQSVPLSHDDGQTVVVVLSPEAPGFVSLRGAATDAAGNTVTVTVIRAYRTTG